MILPYTRMARVTVLGSCLIPLMVWGYNLLKPRTRAEGVDLWSKLAGIGVLFAAGYVLTVLAPRWYARTLEAWSRKQRAWTRALPERWVGAAILASAGLSLALELSIIRWQGTVFELFGFYKNFGLLACFAGLGLGYALAGRRPLPLALCLPLLGWQFLVLIFTRYGGGGWNVGILRSTPVLEQLNMGVGTATALHEYAAVTLLLGTVFMLTALAFVPIGQLCGALLRRRANLPAYGLNLLGSLLGVLFVFGCSYGW